MTAFLLFHFAGGSLAVVAGYAALFARKGGRLHRRAGMLFVYGMIAMGIGAIAVGLERGKPSWWGGPMVIYLVLTSMLTVSRTRAPSRTRDIALMLFGLVLGGVFLYGGVRGLMAPRGSLGAAPAVASLVYAFVLLLCVAGDVRVLRSGPLAGSARLARHLWRMCFAMFAATGSFFLGQSQVIPEALRIGPLLFVLAFLPLPAMFYWLWRVRRRLPATSGTASTRVSVASAG